MTLDEALRASSIAACRGYEPESNKCVVSIAYYGGRMCWLEGWGGHWAKGWVPVPEDKKDKLEGLDFKPTGPRSREDFIEILEEIYDEDFDEFEPIADIMKD